MPGEFQVTNSPVTASGTLTVSKNNQGLNTVYAGPATGPGGSVPTFRALVLADLPAGVVTGGPYLPLTGGTLSGGLAGTTAVFSGFSQTGGTLRASGGPANVGSFTWAQLNTTFNTLANSGAMGIGWNYSAGGGETDFFINRNGGGGGGLNIYDFPNTSGTPLQIFSLTGAGALNVPGNLSGGNLGTTGTLTVNGNSSMTGSLSVGGALVAKLPIYLGPSATGPGQIYVESTNTNYVFLLPSGNGAYYFYNAGGAATLVSIANNGALTAFNAITTTGGTASFTFADRGGAAPVNWQLYATGGQALIWNSRDGNVIFINPHLTPAANNTYWCGLPYPANGNSWYGVSAYTFNTVSDISQKTDIAELPDCLDFVQALAPKRYRFNNGPREDRGIVHWGFVAQHVGEVFKEHNFGGHRTDRRGISQGLNYNELVAVLWKAVQELTTQVAELGLNYNELVAVLWKAVQELTTQVAELRDGRITG
jgi:hypothetical protein